MCYKLCGTMASAHVDEEAKGGESGGATATDRDRVAGPGQVVVAGGGNNDGQLGLGVKAVGRAVDTPTPIPRFKELGVTISKVSGSVSGLC